MSSANAVGASEFKHMASEVAGWLWGTVQGAWNEKQTTAQVITDAVIGMIPLVGQATAARDLLAVGTGLADNPQKRENVWDWMLFVILLLALIPVLGGVLKGVGRLTLRATEEAMQNSAKLAQLADDMVAVLNRLGHRDAVKWLKQLDFAKYEPQVLERCQAFCDTVILALNRYALRFGKVLPQGFVQRLQALVKGFEEVKAAAGQMVPQAIKELNQRLKNIQAHIVAGGVPPPNRAVQYQAQTGQRVVTYHEEARLLENGVKKAVRRAGPYPQNRASAHPGAAADVAKVYTPKEGFPNLLGRKEQRTVFDQNIKKNVDVEFYTGIAAAHGKIRNVDLGEEGAVLFRAFGPGGRTHGVDVGTSSPGGFWWGMGEAPKTAKEWREKFAVLDEFNRNGWVTVMRIPKGVKVPACTSTVSEQYSLKIAGQYLEGGAKQAAVDFKLAPELSHVDDSMKALIAKGGGKATLPNGIQIEVRQSGWGGINGKIGYGEDVIPNAPIVERLGVTELQTKMTQTGAQQGVQQAGAASAGGAKEQRAAQQRKGP